LKAAALSTEKVTEMMKLTKKEIEVTMQMVSAANLAQLEGKLVPQLPVTPLSKM
jgi:isopentenyl diphosphate isomerase/L-lactate dehydrogenase-like FMN-dependent dehydrogenase